MLTLLGLFVVVIVLAGVMAIGVVTTVWETWVALKLWSWYSPAAWNPLPFGFWQAVGLNLLVSLVIRQRNTPSVEKSGEELAKHVAKRITESGFLVPAIVLFIGWTLKVIFL